MVSKLGVLYAQEGNAVANGGGVATHLSTAPTVAKANAVEAEAVAAAAVETLVVSFQDPPLTSCLNIVMTALAPPGTFIPMMLSLQLQRPSLHLALPATMPHAKGRLLLFLAKLPMKLPVCILRIIYMYVYIEVLARFSLLFYTSSLLYYVMYKLVRTITA